MVGDLSTWYLGEEAISAAAAAAPTAVDTGEGGSAPGTMAAAAAASTQRGLFFGVAIGEDACLKK